MWAKIAEFFKDSLKVIFVNIDVVGLLKLIINTIFGLVLLTGLGYCSYKGCQGVDSVKSFFKEHQDKQDKKTAYEIVLKTEFLKTQI
jgi:hypothetical protein